MSSPLAIDCHLHSKDSDWIDSTGEISKEISWMAWNFSGNVIAVLTNHNEATKRLSWNWFYTFSWVEVTTIEQDEWTWFMAHLLLYARNFSNRVDESLKPVREKQMFNIMQNIHTLREHNFDVSYEKFTDFFANNHYNTENINRFQLARYVMSNEKNRGIANDALRDFHITDDVPWYVLFLKHFLYKNGDCGEYGYSDNRKLSGIHPSELAEIAIQEDGIISFAHPQVTCENWWMDEFREKFIRFYELYNVRAIEVPAVASLKWTEFIIALAEEFKCLLTFWTDSHGYAADAKHGNRMHINPFAPKSIVDLHGNILRERFCEDEKIVHVW